MEAAGRPTSGVRRAALANHPSFRGYATVAPRGEDRPPSLLHVVSFSVAVEAGQDVPPAHLHRADVESELDQALGRGRVDPALEVELGYSVPWARSSASFSSERLAS
jgi:hypothetical protein